MLSAFSSSSFTRSSFSGTRTSENTSSFEFVHWRLFWWLSVLPIVTAVTLVTLDYNHLLILCLIHEPGSCPRVEVLSLPHHFIASELEGKQYVVCTQSILDEWLNKYINVLMQNLYSQMSRKKSIFNLVNYFLYISWKEGSIPGQKALYLQQF